MTIYSSNWTFRTGHCNIQMDQINTFYNFNLYTHMSVVSQFKKQKAFSIHNGLKLSKLIEGNWYPCENWKTSSKMPLIYIAIINKMSKFKNREFWEQQKKSDLCVMKHTFRHSVNFLPESFKARREDDIFYVLWEKKSTKCTMYCKTAEMKSRFTVSGSPCKKAGSCHSILTARQS